MTTSRWSTRPGVARVCQAIAANPEDARRLTVKRNSVAVVTDGSAVLGLGNIGPAAALPVMEGKAALFKRFAGIDAWPLCLDTQDPDAIVEIVRAVSPGFAGINLEDISAPRCFEIEARLREILDIPVFHDDQHGTAIVVLAALTNALRVVGKDLADVRVVMSGAGAAGTAILRLLLEAGAQDVVVADVEGVIYRDRPGLHESLHALAEATNKHRPHRRAARRRCVGADVFIGVSAPNLLDGDDVAADGRRTRSSSRWPTRCPRSTPGWPASTPPWSRPAARTTPTRSTTCWRSPGVFRGLLDALGQPDRRHAAGGRRRGDRRAWSPPTSSTPTTSSRASSTPTCTPPSPPPCARPRRRAARWRRSMPTGAMPEPAEAARGVAPGDLLVATPALLDPNFERTVVLVLDVDEDGALGVVLNRPSTVRSREILPGLDRVAGVARRAVPGRPGEHRLGARGRPPSARRQDAEPVGFRRLYDDVGIVDLDTPTEIVRAGADRAADLRRLRRVGRRSSSRTEIAEGSWYVVPSRPGRPVRRRPAGAVDAGAAPPARASWPGSPPARLDPTHELSTAGAGAR